jgi:diacylglycerol kinase (ATP)
MRAAAVLGPGLDESVLGPFRSPGAEISLLKNLRDDGDLDALLVFGGDGTVHHQLPFLMQRKIPLLVVPSGSGNDFAVCMGIRDQQAALELWRKFQSGAASIRELDLGVIRFQGSGSGERERRDIASYVSTPEGAAERYFCNIAGIGLDAAANRRANAYPRWLRGHGGYVLAALTAMCTEKAQKIEVSISGDDAAGAHQGEWSGWLHEPATLLAIGNTQSYGGGMRITPRAQPDDGKLDICFVRECGALRLLQLFPSVFKGGHLNKTEIAYTQAGRVRITTPQPMDIYADGEFAGRTPAEFSLLPRALRVIAAFS